MAQTSLTCSECGATLRLAGAVAPGKKIHCPKCQNVFTVPNAAIRKSPAPRPVAVEVEDEPEEDLEDEPRQPRQRRKKATPSRKPVLLLGGIGLLLVAGIVTTIILVTRPKEETKKPSDGGTNQSTGGPRSLEEVKAATVLIKVQSGPLTTSG